MLAGTGQWLSAETPPKLPCGMAAANNIYRLYVGQLSQAPPSQSLQAVGKKDMSMAEVRDYAKSLGLNLTGVKCTVDEVRALNRPAIVAMKDDHFTVVEKISDSYVRMFEGDSAISLVPRKDFEDAFTGFALVPLADLPGKAEPDNISVDDSIVDVGSVAANSTMERTFVIHNNGDSPLKILSVEACCGAIAEVQGGYTIEPKANRAIKVTYQVAVGSPVLEKNVMILTDGQHWPILYLTATGKVVEDALPIPQILDFGRVQRGMIGERQLQVRHLTPDQQKNVSLRCDAKYVQVEAGAYDLATQVWTIFIRLNSADLHGRIKDTLSIDLKQNGALAQIRIPIYGDVVSPVSVTPQQLILGLIRKGTQASARTRLTCDSQRQFSILDVKGPNGVAVSWRKENNGYIVEASVGTEPAFDSLDSIITVFTDMPEDERIDIPIRGAWEP